MNITKEQSNYIKLIAIISMFIDHAGLLLFPEAIVMRAVGRIAFPLFAFQIGVGYYHTKNLRKYFLRLFVYGVALQMPYALWAFVFEFNILYFNIFFTLSAGLAAIYFYDKRKYISLALLLSAIFATEFTPLEFDYSIYGVLVILMLFITHENRLLMIVSLSALTFIQCVSSGSFLQIFCVFSMFFILKPFNMNIRIPDRVFYVFYPLHLLILYCIGFMM